VMGKETDHVGVLSGANHKSHYSRRVIACASVPKGQGCSGRRGCGLLR
jgi:hypothetical protein